MSKLKLLIAGHGRHGKDTVAEMFRDRHGYSFASSSWVAAEEVVIPYMVRNNIVEYDSVQACFDDRHAYRAVWFNAISEFNTPDKTRLATYIWDRYDIYVGMRNHKELWACRACGLFDFAVWIDASDRHPPEPSSSMTIEPWMCDFHIDNNGDLDETRLNVDRLSKYLNNEH